MKNILKEKPTLTLHGRFLEGIDFVSNSDIENKEVLNIGCGFGWCELNFLQRGVKKIIGTEISKEALKETKDFFKDKRAHFEVADGTNLPFQNESFDTVVCWEVLEHIPKNLENKMFREVNRVFKKDGVFYLSTPYDSFFAKVFDPAWWLISHRHYSFKKLEKLGKNNSLKVVDCRIKGGWWFILFSLNMYIAKWIFRRKPFFERLLIKNINQEFEKPKGFTNIFVKFKKTL